MPLFKGSSSSGSGKAIDYITDEKKAELISSQNLDDDRSYADQFAETAKLYGKGKKQDERKCYHFKLSCDRADGVSAEAHQVYAEAVAQKLFPNYECVIATHTDTGTVHSHIVVNAVSFETGRKLHYNNSQYLKMKDIVNQLGVERGYSQLIYHAPSRDQLTRAEQEIKAKGGTSWKEELREVIAEAKTKTNNMADFEKHLNDYGITLTRNTEKTIAYKHPEKEKAIRGEKLGLDYTKGEIMNVFEEQQREHARTNRANTDDEPDQENGTGKRTSQGSVSDVERTMRGITESIRGLTNDGRAEQAERKRRIRDAAERDEQEYISVEERERTEEKSRDGKSFKRDGNDQSEHTRSKNSQQLAQPKHQRRDQELDR